MESERENQKSRGEQTSFVGKKVNPLQGEKKQKNTSFRSQKFSIPGFGYTALNIN